MKTTQGAVLLTVALLVASAPVSAVMPATTRAAGTAGMPVSATATTSRGGTVTAIGANRETITVSGVTYRFALPPSKIHADSRSGAASARLEVGSQITFETRKDSSGGEQIVEIWLLSTGGAASKK